MKKLFILFLFITIGCCFLFASGQSDDTADRKQSEETETLMEEANRQAGMPNIINFQQKKLMKMIYELCDREDLICYAYMYSDYKGELIYIGRCIGYGIPFSAQYSNPESYKDDPNGSWDAGSLVLPQPEPNGLFMPISSSATWLMMVDPETKEPRPVYFEPTIVVSPFPLQ